MSIQTIESKSSILELDLPDTFEKMSEETVAKVLKNVENTQFFRDKDRGFMITVTDKVLSGVENINIDTALNAYCISYGRTVAGFRSPYMGKKEINGLLFGVLGFYSTTLTADHFNLLFITLIDGVEVTVTMQSRLQDFMFSKKEFLSIINTAKVKLKSEKTA